VAGSGWHSMGELPAAGRRPRAAAMNGARCPSQAQCVGQQPGRVLVGGVVIPRFRSLTGRWLRPASASSSCDRRPRPAAAAASPRTSSWPLRRPTALETRPRLWPGTGPAPKSLRRPDHPATAPAPASQASRGGVPHGLRPARLRLPGPPGHAPAPSARSDGRQRDSTCRSIYVGLRVARRVW
jgi:hypothetical protein